LVRGSILEGCCRPRKEAREKICPISGPGKLSDPERQRKAKEIIAASGADTVKHFNKVVRSNHGVTFREQAIIWLAQMQDRKRKPVAPSTLGIWESALRNWLNPNIGDMPLESIGNLALKNLGATMVKGGLGASAIRSYTNAVKMVVASAVNEEGDALHPRKWNHDFIDLPEDKNPKQPIFTSDVVTGIVAGPQTKQMLMFHTLCAAAGLRFGEALGIDLKYISSDCSTITICQKAWRGQIHSFLKSNAAKREVDLHSSIAAMLKEFIGGRAAGLLFASRTGKQLSQTNIRRRSLHPILEDLGWKDPESGCKKTGAHAYRRFRLTWLRKNNVPKDLEHFWMGHDDEEIGDIYSKLKQDVAFRKEVAERIGVGFELPSKNVVVGPNGPKPEVGDVELLAVNT
jgi:integrase